MNDVTAGPEHWTSLLMCLRALLVRFQAPAAGIANATATLSPLPYDGLCFARKGMLLLRMPSYVSVGGTLIPAFRAMTCINLGTNELGQFMVGLVLAALCTSVFCISGKQLGGGLGNIDCGEGALSGADTPCLEQEAPSQQHCLPKQNRAGLLVKMSHEGPPACKALAT